MKRSTRRILTAIAIPIVLVLAILAVVPLFFRDQISQRAKVAVNGNLNARVDWRDVGLSFFRNFPNLTLTLDDLTTVGTGTFQADTLAAVPHLRVALSLPSVVGYLTAGRPIVVREVELDRPRLSLIKLADGRANWDVTRKTATSDTTSSMAVKLRNVKINDAAIAFDNRQTRLKASVRGYNQSLSGDLSKQRVSVETRADADTATVVFAGVPYLNNVRLGLTADVQADQTAKTYTITQTELRLNDLKLGVSGSARSTGKVMGLDLAFNAPSTNFRSILSLVPAIYAHEFDKLKTSGSFGMNGRVKGQYGDSVFPGFAINTKVNDAAFQYPDLPLPARSIFMDLTLTNPGGSPDSTVVKLDRFHMLLGKNPVDARMVLRTPISDPDVDAQMKGKVDLADVRRTVKLEGIDQLAGIIAGNATVRARMSALDRKQYDRVAASGNVDVSGFTVKGKNLPHPLAIQQASLTLAPQRAQLKSFTGSLGNSDFRATGTLDNLLGFALRDEVLRGSATVQSNRFDLDEWRTGDTTSLQIIRVPPKIDLGLNATANQLSYGKLTMRDARARLRVKDQRVTLESFQTSTLGGQIGLTGFYETTDSIKPTFDVGFKMNRLDIPSAFQAFTTVQMLAPVARYAMGKVTSDLHLNGALGKNMLPLFPSLRGQGTLLTSQVALHGFPAMNKIVEVTKLEFLNNPTMQAIKAAFQIQQGRLVVQPFDVKLGPVAMTVSGSNGFDQSLQYALDLHVPRSLLGSSANQALASVVSKAGKAGIDLNAASEIPLRIELAGSVTNPIVKTDLGSAPTSVARGATQAVQTAAKQKVSAEASRLVQQAEQKASVIRQEAQSLADKVKQQGYQQADALTAKADNPILKAAAEPAAEQIRKESDNKAEGIVSEASRRADSLVSAAQQQADQMSR